MGNSYGVLCGPADDFEAATASNGGPAAIAIAITAIGGWSHWIHCVDHYDCKVAVGRC